MKENLLIQIVQLIISLFSFKRNVIYFAVFIYCSLENDRRKGDSDESSASEELEHVCDLLDSYLPEKDSEVLIGDSAEHYELLRLSKGKDFADKWLLKETAESLSKAIPWRVAVNFARTSARRLIGTHYKVRRRGRPENLTALCWLKVQLRGRIIAHLVPVALITLLTSAGWLSMQELPERRASEDQLSGKARQVEVTPGKEPARDGPGTQRATKVHTPRPESPSSEVEEGSKPGQKALADLPERSLDRFSPPRGLEMNREGEDLGKPIPKVSRARVRFRLPLVDGSDIGKYNVILVDAHARPLLKVRATSYDGKFLDVYLNLQNISPQSCSVLVWRGTDAPTSYPVEISAR